MKKSERLDVDLIKQFREGLEDLKAGNIKIIGRQIRTSEKNIRKRKIKKFEY